MVTAAGKQKFRRLNPVLVLKLFYVTKLDLKSKETTFGFFSALCDGSIFFDFLEVSSKERAFCESKGIPLVPLQRLDSFRNKIATILCLSDVFNYAKAPNLGCTFRQLDKIKSNQ